ncbi:MAG: hypothetical protein QOD91_609 [Frankiales bacterium]|nr:hypothetical protein [Frankiales bacterium]
MPLSASAADARAWADWISELRHQIARAKEAGRLGDINAPQDITDRLLAIMTEISACGADTATITVDAVDWPGFENWAHYHRTVLVWVADLHARGIIATELTPQAARFSDALRGYAGLARKEGTDKPAVIHVQGKEPSAESR